MSHILAVFDEGRQSKEVVEQLKAQAGAGGEVFTTKWTGERSRSCSLASSIILIP
jgi:hypothetical protein